MSDNVDENTDNAVVEGSDNEPLMIDPADVVAVYSAARGPDFDELQRLKKQRRNFTLLLRDLDQKADELIATTNNTDGKLSSGALALFKASAEAFLVDGKGEGGVAVPTLAGVLDKVMSTFTVHEEVVDETLGRRADLEGDDTLMGDDTLPAAE